MPVPSLIGRRSIRTLWKFFWAGSLAAAWASHAQAETVEAAAADPSAASVSSSQAVEPAEPLDARDELSGDDIYHRILDNRFSAFIQDLVMQSGDRGGNALRTEVTLRYKNYRKINKRVLSKSIAKYRAPQDVRHLGYLVINKSNGRNDEFIFQPSSRRVRRVNLRGESVFGTDFSFEDIIPQEFEDGTYVRLADATIADVDCYVVEVIPTQKADSEYSKFVVHVDKEHFVPLQSDYWDKREVHIKRLRAEPGSMKGFEAADVDGIKKVWVATNQRVDHLKLETWTQLEITQLLAKPKLRERDFSERELTSSH